MKSIFLTFDVEEFDYPNFMGIKISEREKYGISYGGVKEVLKLLNKHKVVAIFFVTAKFALKYPKLIKEIAKKHEVASHGYSHEHNYNKVREDFAFENIKKWFLSPVENGGIFSLFLRKRGIIGKPEGVVFHNVKNPVLKHGRVRVLEHPKNALLKEHFSGLKTGQMAKLRLDMFKEFKGERHKENEK